jgi:hypothetical protein
VIKVSSLIGTNIHNIALGVIGCRESVLWYQYDSRKLNAERNYVTIYKSAVEVKNCSMMPINQEVYNEDGRNLQKSAWSLRLPAKVVDVNRGVSGDQFEWRGKRYQSVSKNDILILDGWVTVKVTEI